MSYFYKCFTPEELKALYRDWAKNLHPDKGGTAKEFQDMQNEYDNYKVTIDRNENIATIPDYFNHKGVYEYFRRPVKYIGIYYNHYYKFTQDKGADILIDVDHINLIFTKRALI